MPPAAAAEAPSPPAPSASRNDAKSRLMARRCSLSLSMGLLGRFGVNKSR